LELLAEECVDLLNHEKGLGLHVSPTLFIEFHGPTKNHLADMSDMAQDICHQEGCHVFRVGLDRSERDRFMEARYGLGETIIQKHHDFSLMTIDVAVPVSAYPEMIALAREEARRAGILTAYIFGHAGDGNIHLVTGAKQGDPEWVKIHELNDRMVRKAINLGGTATGEHGVGIGKIKFMELEHGNALAWMKRLKSLFDPHGILNPGKMFP
jgi:D-lactate dehydrogenase (cytochrome)